MNMMRYFFTFLMVCASLAIIATAQAENAVAAKPTTAMQAPQTTQSTPATQAPQTTQAPQPGQPAQQIQQPTPEQMKQLDRLVEILQTVASPDGHIDKALHDEFWKIVTENNLATEIDFTRVNDESNKFDVEVWQSIKLSLAKGKVTKTPDYETYKAQMLKKYPSDQLSSSITRYEGMMASAANKKPISTAKGPVNLSEELVTKTIADLEASYKRRNKLMKKDWTE
jgi:hypothetical protein